MAQSIKVGINGFGRIGRKVLRLALERQDVEIAAVNDLGDLQTAAHLLKYDSVHGTLRDDVHTEGDCLVIRGTKVPFSKDRDPAQLKWDQSGVQIVHECTGIFTSREKAALHLKGGARKVIISAPSNDADTTICMGVNEKDFDTTQHEIISNASCTTNCLAPMVKVVDEAFGVLRGTMTTVHSYTNDQHILDLPHKDLRRARAAALSMIPTTTGAAKAVGLVLPHLMGKIDGYAIRVPTPNVSLVDFTAELKIKTTAEEVNQKLRVAAEGQLKGILGFETAPLVSSDYNGNTRSSTIDASLTSVLDGNLLKVVTWYDNESGFSQRMLDLTVHIAQSGL